MYKLNQIKEVQKQHYQYFYRDKSTVFVMLTQVFQLTRQKAMTSGTNVLIFNSNTFVYLKQSSATSCLRVSSQLSGVYETKLFLFLQVTSLKCFHVLNTGSKLRTKYITQHLRLKRAPINRRGRCFLFVTVRIYYLLTREQLHQC